MKKILSLVLVFALLFTSTISFAESQSTAVKLPDLDISVEVLDNNTFYENGNLQGEITYLIDGEVVKYNISSDSAITNVKVVFESSKISENVTYNKQEGTIKTDSSLLANVTLIKQEEPITPLSVRGSTSWSEQPFFGSPSDYNVYISTQHGNVRFTETIMTAIVSGLTGTATGLIIAVIISSTGVGIVAGGIAGAIIAALTYNPQDAAYFTKITYRHQIPGYYRYLTAFYYDPDHNSFWGNNDVYAMFW
jgi:hypothetical protein